MRRATNSLSYGLAPGPVVLLAALGMLLLAHLTRLPVWLSLLLIGTLIWRLFHDLGRLKLPGRWLRVLLVLASGLGILASYHSLIGREAGSALLLLLTFLKLTEMRTPRDVIVVIFLGYFLVVLSFLFGQSIPYTLWLFGILLVLLFAQLMYSHPTTPVQAWGLFTPQFKLTLRLVVQALPLALLLFVFFPRVSGPLWALPADAGSARTGLSDEMAPGRISRLSNDDAVAFRVKFAGQPPSPQRLYWRGLVHWYYDGERWTSPLPQRQELTGSNLAITPLGPVLDYTVTLEPHDQYWLFLLDTPARMPANSQITVDRQVLARQRIEKLRRYRASSYLDYRIEPDLPVAGRERYLSLPPYISPRSQQLMEQLRARYPQDRKLVQAVLDYFHNQPFYYTRNAPLLYDDPVDTFLFETRRGFCEHYASAFTVMMRQADIPARVVTGYQGGEINPLSDYMIVRQSDAHAWSEVWLKGDGWVRVDPTSVIPPGRIENTDDILHRQPQTGVAQKLLEQSWLRHGLRQVGFAWDAVNNRWNQWVVGFNRTRQASMFTALGVPDLDWPGLALLLGLTSLITLGLIAWRVLHMPRSPRDPVQQAYLLFCRRLARIGLQKLPHETPARFEQRVRASRQDLAKTVASITALYLDLRYGRAATSRRTQQLVELVHQFKPS
jgi:transglutaminase-like putative cysteine protease